MTLEDEFSGELEFVPIQDAGATGNFEVFINDTLVHSKKAGAGRCETKAEVDGIKAHIQAILDSK